MSPSHARRLKELEVENARLKKLLAEAELEGGAHGAGRGKMVTPDRRRIAVERVHVRFGISERRACAVVASTARPSAAPRRPQTRLRPACVSIRETSRAVIHASGGARPMR